MSVRRHEPEGQKMPPYVGEDGKLYFNFAQGLEVLIRERLQGGNVDEYTYKIAACRYIGTTEYYDVEQNGVLKPAPDSANRVKYLISRYGVKTLYTGKRLELPLTVDEVKQYYAHRESVYETANAAALLIPEYKALRSECNGLYRKIGFAEVYGKTDEAAELESRQAELRRKMENVLRAHMINPDDLTPLPYCDRCGGKGFNVFGVCKCAEGQSDKIKAYNAAERLRLRRLINNN